MTKHREMTDLLSAQVRMANTEKMIRNSGLLPTKEV